jgi:benzoyl-CoA reductase/2-hydroxyglutaryl-CoA dehydratase subunit BcrC/BadD/HgdB
MLSWRHLVKNRRHQNVFPEKITIGEWNDRYARLPALRAGQPPYGGRFGRHINDGDLRLRELKFDNSRASLDLWNFLLTEEDRLHKARKDGKRIVGTMKDLGTVPVMAYSLPNLVAFYPDGAWWIPCVMKSKSHLLEIANSLGIDESFCPVRAMLGAFVSKAHFPIPDLLACSVGATCDDFSAIAQRLEGLGHSILWWEIPHRREPDRGEKSVKLPGGRKAPATQVEFVEAELRRIRHSLAELAGKQLDDNMLAKGITAANNIRRCLDELRRLVFTATPAPLPALELLVAEMMAIHFCSDRTETLRVLTALLAEVKTRVAEGRGFLDGNAVKVFWINPAADLRIMNIMEDCEARLCGSEYMFTHALDVIPVNLPPMNALARMALADPMAGSAQDRADRICSDIRKFGSEAAVICRIPGASHCALESRIITDIIQSRLDIPVADIEAPSITDSIAPTLRTRLQALVETVRKRRS